jgi:hypothetical protein
VLLAGLVVEQRPALDRLLNAVDRDLPAAVRHRRSGDGELEQPERRARVAVRVDRNRGQRLRLDVHGFPAQAAIRVTKRPFDDRLHFGDRESAQDEHLGPGEQRGIHLERRVFGRRADEHDVAGFDPRQERVLLRLVEAVNLVDEHDRPAACRPAHAFGLGHDLADLLDPREHRTERHEPGFGRFGDDPSERGLAGTGRSPQDDRLE